MHAQVPMSGVLVEQVLDALPDPVFVVDPEAHVLAYNEAASAFLHDQGDGTLNQLFGAALACLNQQGLGRACGRTSACAGCKIRAAIESCWSENGTFRQRHEFQRAGPDGTTESLYLLISASPLRAAESPLAVVVLEDVSEVNRLHHMLPICSVCKKVRDDQDAWHAVELYVAEHTDVTFSHGYCDACADKVFGELEARREQKKRSGD